MPANSPDLPGLPAARAATVLADVWADAALEPQALERVELSGDQPVLPSSFAVDVAAQSSIAAAARGARSYRFRQRAKAFLAQARGRSVAQPAQHYGRERDTISRWIHAWEEHGVAGLLDAPRAGRPPKLAPTAQKNS